MVFGGRSAVPFLHTNREEGLVRGISVFRTRQGQAEALVEACRGVANIPNDAEGSRSASLHRGVEDPDSFTPIVEWDSVQAHTDLTQRPQFESFGEAIAPYLAGQPEVRHVEAAD
jgi:quinol monooxygenase YgiN